jgi:hypothetical protein
MLSRDQRKRMKEELAREREHGIPVKKKRGIRAWFITDNKVKADDGTELTMAEFEGQKQAGDISWEVRRNYADPVNDIVFAPATECLPLGSMPDEYVGGAAKKERVGRPKKTIVEKIAGMFEHRSSDPADAFIGGPELPVVPRPELVEFKRIDMGPYEFRLSDPYEGIKQRMNQDLNRLL